MEPAVDRRETADLALDPAEVALAAMDPIARRKT